MTITDVIWGMSWHHKRPHIAIFGLIIFATPSFWQFLCHYGVPSQKKLISKLWDVLSNLISWFDNWEPLIWSQVTSLDGNPSEVGIQRMSTDREVCYMWSLKHLLNDIWRTRTCDSSSKILRQHLMLTEHDLTKKYLWHLKPQPGATKHVIGQCDILY